MLTATGLHYKRRGSGPPLVLIQGMAATHLHWGDELISLLARSFDVVTFDHRGVGHSPPVTGAFTLAELADDVVELLDATGWSRAHVFGVSMGSCVAQQLAFRHRERVHRLVLGCTSSDGPAITDPDSPLWSGLASAMVRGDRTRTLCNVFRLNVAPASAGRRDVWETFEAASLALPVHPRVTVLQLNAMAQHHADAWLPLLTMPTLVIHGDADSLVPVDAARHVARAMPNAEFAVLAAGHMFWLEQPGRTADLVCSWLNGTAQETVADDANVPRT